MSCNIIVRVSICGGGSGQREDTQRAAAGPRYAAQHQTLSDSVDIISASKDAAIGRPQRPRHLPAPLDLEPPPSPHGFYRQRWLTPPPFFVYTLLPVMYWNAQVTVATTTADIEMFTSYSPCFNVSTMHLYMISPLLTIICASPECGYIFGS